MSERGIVSEILRQKLSGTRDKAGTRAAQETKRTSISLPEGLYRQIKALAAIEGRKMNDLMVELLRESMEKRLAQKDPFKGW